MSFLWLLLSVGSQGRNPNPAGTLIPCLTLGPVWVTGWLYGDGAGHVRAVLSCLLTLYTAVMSFEILFPFGLWVSEPGWLLNHSQLV